MADFPTISAFPADYQPPPTWNQLPLSEKIERAVVENDFGYADWEEAEVLPGLTFRKQDLAAFGIDLVSFVVPPLFAVRAICDKKGWEESPALQCAMIAFSLAGTLPMAFALTRGIVKFLGGVEKLEKAVWYAKASRVGALLVNIQTAAGAPLMIGQTLSAATNVAGNLWTMVRVTITGEKRSLAAERGQLLRDALQLLPLAAIYKRPLNRLLWSRRETVRASEIAIRTIEGEDVSFLHARKNAMNPLPQRGMPADPYAPKVTHDFSQRGEHTVTIDYRGVRHDRFRLPGLSEDLRSNVTYAMDGCPAAADSPLGIAKISTQWASRLMGNHGVTKIVHHGVEQIPQKPFTIAQLTHWDTPDIPAILASGDPLKILVSQLGKKGLAWIPALREAVQINMLNPIGEGFTERAIDHLNRPHMGEDLRPANLSYTTGHRTTRPMELTGRRMEFADRLRQAGVRVWEQPRRNGTRATLFQPTEAVLFEPHKGVFLEAISTETDVVPLVSHYVRGANGSIEIHYHWFAPISCPEPIANPLEAKPKDLFRAAEKFKQELVEAIEQTIIPSLDYLKLYLPFEYKKPRKNTVAELLVSLLKGHATG